MQSLACLKRIDSILRRKNRNEENYYRNGQGDAGGFCDGLLGWSLCFDHNHAASKYPAIWYPTSMNPTVMSTVFVAKESRKKLFCVRQTLSTISTAVSASTCPISTPTLKLMMLVNNPSFAKSNSWSLVAKPKP